MEKSLIFVTLRWPDSPSISRPPTWTAIEKEDCMSEHAENVVIGSPRPTVTVSLKQSPDLASITKVIESIGGQHGCRTCGLLGFDLLLKGDPELKTVEK
jgi:hypothetical protein